MLYKNGQPYTLTKEEVAKYRGKTIYRLSPSLVKWDAVDERVRKPNGIIFEPFYTYFEDGQSCELRIVKSVVPKRDGNVTYNEYNPSEITFPQRGIIEVDNDPEYNMYLANHPRNQDSPNFDKSKQAIFMIENKAEEAKKRVKANAAIFEAQALIFHPNDGLSEKDLRSLARTYPDLVGFADSYTPDEIKDVLFAKANLDPLGFIRQTKDQRAKVLSTLTQAKNMDLVQYIPGKRSWILKENGQEKETICVVKKDKEAQEAMIDYLMFDDKKGFLEFFQRKIDEKESTPVEA